MCPVIWNKLDQEIKTMIFKNGLTHEMIESKVIGELNELAIKTTFGYETLFFGNGEAFITVDVKGKDYNFEYVIDNYSNKKLLINY